MAFIPDYPRTLYTNGLRYRSSKGIFFLVVFSISNAWAIGWWIFHLPVQVPIFVMAIEFALVAATVVLAVYIITDRRAFFRIETTGIITNFGKFVPWSDIVRFGAAEGRFVSGIVYLFYATTASPKRHRLLHFSGRISRDEFDAVARLLNEELAESYPEVQFGVYEIAQPQG